MKPFKQHLNAVAPGASTMDDQLVNQHLKDIINTMNDGMMLVSPAGAIMMANRAMEKITGYSRKELMGSPCSIFQCDACANARSEGRGHWCEIFDVGRAHRRSCLLRRKDGSYVHVLKNASLLKDEEGGVLGAVETITDISEIDRRDQKIAELSKLLERGDLFQGMVGRSPAMRNVFEIIKKAAQSDAPVIISGETGTGKELAAHAIHQLGRRRDGPYIQLNCAALNESLLESELFGHEKGAFTGAYCHRKGWFEAADGGDIFLDEIGDVPIPIQVKLLRVLETKSFQRVGDHQTLSADARIITATNRDLEQLVAEGKFREDFFFRINVIPIHLPPLRERVSDAPLLAEHFIRQLRKKSRKAITGLDAEAMDIFMSHDWPGNVRELRSVLEYAFVIAERGPIRPEHLPARMRGGHGVLAREADCGCRVNEIADPPEAARTPPLLEDREREALIDALVACGGNQTHAARALGVNRVTVWHRIKKHGIDVRKLTAPAH